MTATSAMRVSVAAGLGAVMMLVNGCRTILPYCSMAAATESRSQSVPAVYGTSNHIKQHDK